MSVRNCGELGANLQKIISRLLANDDLVKLLYYDDTNPLSHQSLTSEEKQQQVFEKLIKFTPRVIEGETNQSQVVIYMTNAKKLQGNGEFVEFIITIDVITPLDTWVINDSNLRPFAILGEIQKSLEGKSINGMGVLVGGNFGLSRLTDKVSIYTQTYSISAYD